MNILIIRVSAIGDVIHTLPAFFLLRQELPHARISWIVQEKGASLIAQQSSIDQVITISDRYLTPGNLTRTWKAIKNLRTQKWDAIIDFQGLVKTTFLLMPLHGKKYGFDWKNAREPLSSLCTHQHTNPNYHNIIQKNLSLVSDVIYDLTNTTSCPTLETLQQSFTFEIPDKSLRTIASWITKNKLSKFIVICPNTTWQSKRWPKRYWQQLIQDLTSKFSTHSLIVVGANFGEDAASLVEYAKHNNITIYPVPAWDLITTTGLIKQSSLIIAPDTSFLHLADFLRIPAIGIFGPTSKEKHGPFLYSSNKKYALQAPCPHFYQKSHGGTRNKAFQDCLEHLKPHMVLSRAAQIIKKTDF